MQNSKRPGNSSLERTSSQARFARCGWLFSSSVFTGGTFIAASIAVLIGVYARLAAALSALQMGMFALLVWVPILAKGSLNAFQWGEFWTTLALTAAGWVVADSYRGMRWFDVGKR